MHICLQYSQIEFTEFFFFFAELFALFPVLFQLYPFLKSSIFLVGALEDFVKASQLETVELQHTVNESSGRVEFTKAVHRSPDQITHRIHRVEELEEKERVENEILWG